MEVPRCAYSSCRCVSAVVWSRCMLPVAGNCSLMLAQKSQEAWSSYQEGGQEGGEEGGRSSYQEGQEGGQAGGLSLTVVFGGTGYCRKI